MALGWQTRFGVLMLNAEFTGEVLGRGANGVVEKVKLIIHSSTAG